MKQSGNILEFVKNELRELAENVIYDIDITDRKATAMVNKTFHFEGVQIDLLGEISADVTYYRAATRLDPEELDISDNKTYSGAMTFSEDEVVLYDNESEIIEI